MNPSRQQTRPWSGARTASASTPVSPPSRTPTHRSASTKPRKRPRKEARSLLQTLQRRFSQISLGVVVAAGVLFASLDVSTDLQQPTADAQWARTAGARPVWMVDIDGDGGADFANPTRTFLRGNDIYGSGSFLAGRDHSRRKHMGTDFIATAGDPVRAPVSGVVTQVGAAYGNDPYLRFIEIADRRQKLNVRLFYVQPGVKVGKRVSAGDIIGAAQSLDRRYPLITNHVHVEMRDRNGRFLDPALVLPPARPTAETFASAVAKQPARRARPAVRREQGRSTGTLPEAAVAQVAAPAALPTVAAATPAQVTPVAAPRAAATTAAAPVATPAAAPTPAPQPLPDKPATPTS